MRAHAERSHQDWPQRHHDHEIKNVDKLNARKRKQQVVFALRTERGMHNSNKICRAYARLYIPLAYELLAKLFSIKTAQKSSVLTQFEHGICTFSATAKRSKNHKCPQWR